MTEPERTETGERLAPERVAEVLGLTETERAAAERIVADELLDGSGQSPRSPDRSAGSDRDFFHALGGWGALLDLGLPWIAFLVAYAVSDHRLRLALGVAIGVAALVAALRLARRQPLRNVVGGFIGVLISAYVANHTGKAEDVYLPGFAINAVYLVLYLGTVLVRWPLFGVLFGVLTQTGTAWRRDPAMLRAFSRATLVFVALFALRLAVQVPLYLIGSLNALGIAKVALGLPCYALALWLSYVVLRASLPPESWTEARDTATRMLRGRRS